MDCATRKKLKSLQLQIVRLSRICLVCEIWQ